MKLKRFSALALAGVITAGMTLTGCGSLDMYAIVKALHDNGFDGYVRPDHGRMIWGETGKPGYRLYDRALGAAYLNGLFEACEKAAARSGGV